MLATFTTPIWHPRRHYANFGVAFTNLTAMSAANHLTAYFFQIPKNGNITKLGWRNNAASSPVMTLTVDLQTVSDGPQASGTAYKGCVGGTQTNPTATTVYETTLGTQATSVVRGDFVCLVVKVTSFTSGTTTLCGMSTESSDTNMPSCRVLTSSYQTVPGTVPPIYLVYDDGTYETPMGCWSPQLLAVTTGYNSTTTPDEVGIRLKFPFACYISAIRAVTNFAAGSTCDIVLYNSSSVAIGTSPLISLDTDQIGFNGAQGFSYFYVPTSPLLSANAIYYLLFKPTAATANTIKLYTITAGSAAELTGFVGDAQVYWAQQTDAGGITTTSTIYPLIQVGISAIATGPLIQSANFG